MHLGYKFRLKPTPAEENRLRRVAGCNRFVHGWFYHQREAIYKASEGRVHNGYHDHAAQLKWLKVIYPWLAEDSLSQALQQTLMDLEKAYNDFFAGTKGHPKPMRKEDDDSFRLPQACERNGQAIKLPKLGWIRCIITRPVLGEVKNITISRTGQHWYISFCTDMAQLAATKGERELQEKARLEEAERQESQLGSAGLDWGIAQSVTLSDGTVYQLPRLTKREQDKLARLQRRVSGCKRGSANRLKALAKLNTFHQFVSHRRLDALHQLTTQLAKSHRLLVIEDLQVANMTASARGTVDNPGKMVAQKAGLNRSILDLSPAKFRELLTYKCSLYGCTLVVVPPHHTSQECARCHHRHPNNRKTQSGFQCVRCGHQGNADINAAKNILARGVATLAGLAYADYVTAYPPEAGHAFVTFPTSLNGHGSVLGTTLKVA